MKILELEIRNVRGIRELVLMPAGQNLLVSGPNGCGKSAVVDAIDFLLTGHISRLTGEGTKGITLAKHGPHVNSTPKDAMVRGIFQLDSVSEPLEISRSLAASNKLNFSRPPDPPFQHALAVAQLGQHILTRREILRYITADAGSRAKGIQALLNLTDIEDIRKALVRAANDAARDVEASRDHLEAATGAVNATLQQQRYDPSLLLNTINTARAVLGGSAISTAHSAVLKEGLTPPRVPAEAPSFNLTLLERDIDNLARLAEADAKSRIRTLIEVLQELKGALDDDPNLVRSVAHGQLIDLGLELLDDSGMCPLCEAPWEPTKLRAHLEHRKASAQNARAYSQRLRDAVRPVSELATSNGPSLQKLIPSVISAGLVEAAAELSGWKTDLDRLEEKLRGLASRPFEPPIDLDWLKPISEAEKRVTSFAQLKEALRARYPQATPEQTAWDTLTRLTENLKAVEAATAILEQRKALERRATILRDSFVRARDAVLGQLYDEIRDRFVALYRKLHPSEESAFSATLAPADAGLVLEVDFHGRGTHPPHALHSEGHQDSMGLCLFLALAERLSSGIIDLVVLDDVVMSVDMDHRREVCALLATEFPGRQFLITTHDRAWAQQLKSDGVVSNKGTVEFYSWHIDTGPQVNYERDMWERIEKDLQANDVPRAAGRLRRGSEAYFCMVCDALQAPVVFRMNGRWELGDLLPAAIGKYKELLRAAKRAAQSWNDEKAIELLRELDSTSGQVFKRSQAEEWPINASIHYNNWAILSPNDFAPTVEAFRDLYALFGCIQCSTLLKLAKTGPKLVAVRCACSKVSWNLAEKGSEELVI